MATRKRFSKQVMEQVKAPKRVPRAAELHMGQMRPTAPPGVVLNKIGNPDLVIGVDIETHDWLHDQCNKGQIGQFGFYTLRDERDLAYSRMIQLGWVVGCLAADAPPEISKDKFVQPEGFEVSARATNYHKLTHAQVVEGGEPLTEVLRDFMEDIISAFKRGGRVVAHHLEFDAGIIKNELARCGLHDFADQWASMVRRGTCTMDPEIGRWARTCFGKEAGPETSKPIVGLKQMMHWFVPGGGPLVAKHHDAGADAQMHRLLYIALLDFVKQAAPEAFTDGRDVAVDVGNRPDCAAVANLSAQGD